jgi:phytanoyl-CoA hydroxylase
MAIVARIDLERFQAEGYLVVPGVLDPVEDLDPVVREYEALLDDLCGRLHAEGKLPSVYRDLPFGHRLTRVLNEADTDYSRHFDIALPLSGVTEQTPMHLGPAVFGLLTNPRLLDAVEQIVGPEIYSNPIQHVRIKPPERLIPEHLRKSLIAKTDWHQDQGVALPEADDTEMLTVWLPITDATVENGCLQVIPRSHRQGLATHCAVPGKSLQIPEALLGGEPVAVEMKRGSVLFMHRRTKHASLRNVGDDIRWSFDLRYHPVGQPTGRPWLPGFVVRSRTDPASAIADWRAWADLWRAARARLAQPEERKGNRWTNSEAVCA